MTIPYSRWLRQYVGHQKIILPGAAAIIRDARGRVLLQKRSDFGVWGLPGGSMDLGEDVVETVKREVREEVGLEVEPKRLLGMNTSPKFDVVFPNGDEVQVFAALFDCDVVGGKLRADGDEVLETNWFDIGNLPQLTRPAQFALHAANDFRGRTFFDLNIAVARNGAQSVPYVTWLRQCVGHQKIIMTGAAGMIRDARGRVLLQQRRDNGLWGFPGGAQELGESISDTLRREFSEEVGLDVEPTQLIGIYTSPEFDRTYPNGDEAQMFIVFFDCQIVGGKLKKQDQEVLELGWFELDDLPPMMNCCEAKANDAREFRGEAFFR